MAKKNAGKDVSLWVETTKQTDYRSLEDDDLVYDVAVVGGGITGIALAFRLQREGRRVVLLERARIVEWTTGGTTAKLTSQHYLVYDYLIKQHGKEAARAFARANESGIDEIARLSRALGIDCDFRRRDAYVFTGRDDKACDMHAEVVAARGLGLQASFETEIDLPFEVVGAVKFSHQAQFHPRKFLLALAERFVAEGGVLYEQTEVTDILPGSPHTLTTKRGDLRANVIVQASGAPFWGADIFDGRMWTKMSYALAVKLKSGVAYPDGMYITTDSPTRTIRSVPYGDGQLLIYGGESHEYDEKSYDPDRHYAALVDDVAKRFDVEEVMYHWLAGDNMPYDRMPYIGALPEYPTIYVATGYHAWGLAWGMSAAAIITGYITGSPLGWAHHFSLGRLLTR